MLSSLFLVVFFAVVVTANLLAGPYQALFFYQVYRLDVDAYGLENCHMASGCRLNNGVCNFETFIREISLITEKPQIGSDRMPIRDAAGNIIKIKRPDLDVVDWGLIGEGDDLDIFTTEMNKSKFSGDIKNDVLFKDWSKEDKFDLVMSEAEKITANAISKLKADGREPDKAVTSRMLAALQTHANARRYDQAQKITDKFSKFMQSKGFSVALTTIARPPVPTYQQVDIDQTISDNQGRSGFSTKLEQIVRDYVVKENSSGQSKKHVDTIKKALHVYNNLAEACGAA